MKLQRINPSRGSTELICGSCGKAFTRPNSHLRAKTSSCSRECAQKVRPKKQKTLLSKICKVCEKHFQIRKGRGGTGDYCSIPCLANDRGKKLSGENHHNWKGGVSSRTFSSRRAIRQKIAIVGKCEVCGASDNLQGHHIAPYSNAPEKRDLLENIMCVCIRCHADLHPELKGMILSKYSDISSSTL